MNGRQTLFFAPLHQQIHIEINYLGGGKKKGIIFTSTATLWNCLCQDLQQLKHFETFQKKIQKYLSTVPLRLSFTCSALIASIASSSHPSIIFSSACSTQGLRRLTNPEHKTQHTCPILTSLGKERTDIHSL